MHMTSDIICIRLFLAIVQTMYLYVDYYLHQATYFFLVINNNKHEGFPSLSNTVFLFLPVHG